MVTDEPAFRAARLYAALSGPFPPKAAIQAGGSASPVDELVRISAELAAVCDTAPGRWVMRSPDRQRHLLWLHESGKLAEAIAWRRGLPDVDAESAELLAALEGSGSFTMPSLQALLQPPLPSTERDVATLRRLAGAIECAGIVAPAFQNLPEIRAAIDRRNQARRGETLLQHGLVGREDDRNRIADWIGNPVYSTPVQALFVTGLPAIGKSTLLEAALQEVGRRRIDCIVVRLDFDRQGLDLRDLAGLTSEVARQVAAQRPASATALRAARLEASTTPSGRALKGTTAHVMLPEALIASIAQAVASQPGVVLFVLDTLEALVSRGATHPAQLFAWLDALLQRGLRPMAVVTAGRGDLRAALGDRAAGNPVMLDGLTLPESDRLLERLRIPPAARPQIQAQAAGSPLSLRLAASLLTAESVDGGARPTRSAVAGATNDAQRYRALLSRFADPTLKAILQPGLLVRRLNVDLFAAVLIPSSGLPPVDPAEVPRLFDRLTAQDWLLQPMPDAPGWWRQTDLVRPLVFELLQGTPRAPRLHSLAAAWLRPRPETWAKADGLYHALFGRDGGKLPIAPHLAQHFDERMMRELPSEPRERVRLARGDRSAFAESAVPGGAAGATVDRRAVTDMVRALDRGDPEEANFLHRGGFENAHVDPAGPDGMVERRFFWRTGRWSEARQSLRWRDQATAAPTAAQGLDETALADLEMRAEFEGERLARWFRLDPAAAERVARMVNDAGKQRMGGAALVLHLRAVGVPLQMSEPDPSGDAFRLWTAADDDAASSEHKADVARRLCALSPYAEPLRWLIQFKRAPDGVRQHAAVSLAALRDQGWAEAPQTRRDPIEAFAEAGLLAEWLELANLAMPHPDLTVLARSAGRWRRTIAGRWSLGGLPKRWRGPQRVDAVIESRIARLCASPDPLRAAQLEFGAWSTAAPLPDRITRRVPGIVAAPRDGAGMAGSLDAALIAAATLSRLPAALIPAMAVAIAHPAPARRERL